LIVVLQRVTYGNVTINGTISGEVDQGLVILLGVMSDDEENDVDYLVNKVSGLRISIKDVNGSALVVSQFTLCADTRKGRRPSFVHAALPEKGNALYEDFKIKMANQNIPVESGEFGAMMSVNIQNDGPVTIVLDSKK